MQEPEQDMTIEATQERRKAQGGKGRVRLCLFADESGESGLLRLFVRNQRRVALAMPLLALLFVIASSVWAPVGELLAWFAAIMLAQALQLLVFRFCEKGAGPGGAAARRSSDWVGMIAATEFLYGVIWSLPLHFFWQGGNSYQHIFIIAVLMSVGAMRILIAANFMPVVLAGSGVITINIVLRCLAEGHGIYLVMGAIAVIAEIFFVQLSRRLQATARDMLLFKAQREQLIDELIRERDRAERARARAEQASRAKSRFLATMSHELRTPLNAIMGFSEIISAEMFGPLPVPQYKEYAGDIHQSGDYLLNLINDILDLSRIEAGRRELHEEPIDPREEAAECRRLVSVKAREKDQRITLDTPQHLPALLADARAIRQIWLNLLSNAVKFTPRGGHIRMSISRTPDGGMELAVSDNGEGIPAEELSSVMAAFGRGRSADRGAVEGAGLGLPIVDGLARLHDAQVRIVTAVGKGTTVRVAFPPQRVLRGALALAMGSPLSPTQRRLLALTA